MSYSENISSPSEKNEIPNSNLNLLNEGLFDNYLLNFNQLLNKKTDKTEKVSIKKNINNINGNSRNKDNKNSFMLNNSLFFDDEEEIPKTKEKKKKEEKIKEKRYIVDNIENILTKLTKPKKKLIIQEVLLHTIVLLVCIYYWIFLLLTTTKFEQNYCYTNENQFDSCSFEEICEYNENKINIILYNSTFNYHNNTFKNFHDLLYEENKIINEYYRPFFLRYSQLLTKYKLFVKMQMFSMTDKINFAIFLIHKEKWNIFFRYFSFCHFEYYYIMIIIMIAFGGGVGSILFGTLSDIFGRVKIIRITLCISSFATLFIFLIGLSFDNYYKIELKKFNENYKIIGDDSSYSNIISNLFAQNSVRELFNNYFIIFLINIFILSSGLWPLLKSCMALLLENSKNDLEVLINFRKYNFTFGGLPPIVTSLIFINVNNFTLSFLILSILNIITLICSFFFLEESMRYYYEYCEWEKLTQVLLNLYDNNISDFRTLNKKELKEFKKEEKIKEYNNMLKKNKTFIEYNNDDSEKTILYYTKSFFNDIVDKNIALTRNLKRDTDFIIKLNDVKSNPFLILTSLNSNHYLRKSKLLIFIILIILYIVMDLMQKELLEPPFLTVKDFYIDSYCNYILNSIFFSYLVINVLSNYFFYFFLRIDCFKTIIIYALMFICITLIVYHYFIIKEGDPLMDLNQYNFYMMTCYYRDMRNSLLLIIIYLIYFALNGVVFYIYLLILKISKTIYFYMENYLLFLASLIFLCLISFVFLNDFKDIYYFMNDLKIDIFRPSKNGQEKKKTN